MESVLIVGCGHIGRRVAVQLHARGQRVTGMVRSAASAGRLRALGIEALCLDLDAGVRHIPRSGSFGAVGYFAPPPSTGTQDTRMQRLLEAFDNTSLPRRIVYISTSAVYGGDGTIREVTTSVCASGPIFTRQMRRWTSRTW